MGKKTRTQYSILNIATGLGGYIINTILGLVCRAVFTRTLAEEYLGINGLFTNILSMLSLAELGIGSAIVYALYKPLATNDREKIASLVQFYGKCYRAIGITVAVAGMSLIPFLNVLIKDQPNIKENLYFIFILYLFNTASSYFFSYRSSLIMAAQQNYIVTGLNYIVTIIQNALQMIWLLATHEYIGYLIISIACGFINNIIISYIAKKKFPYIVGKNIKPLEKEEKRGLIRNVRALVVWKLSGLLVNSTDNIIISYFNGLIAVGKASNYTLLASTLRHLVNQLFTGITASVGNLNAIESKEKRMRIFHSINFANFWIYGWGAIGIFIVSSDLVGFFFGEKYLLSIGIPFVLALDTYMVGMQNAVWTFKNTMGLFRPGRYLLIVTAAINLICSFALGKVWGLFGIYLATAISRACTNTWYDPYAVFKHGFKESSWPYFKRYFAFLIILVATGGLCYFICSFIHFSLGINVILKLIICTVIPNGVFFILFKNTEDFGYFKGLIAGGSKKFMSRFKH